MADWFIATEGVKVVKDSGHDGNRLAGNHGRNRLAGNSGRNRLAGTEN